MCANPVLTRKFVGNVPMSDVEWQTRVDLAACYRLFAHYGMDDLVTTHISARLPGKDEHFLLNPYGMLFSEVTASALLKIDIEGNLLQESEYEVNIPGFVIHSAVHKARHDVACVLHTHTVAGIAIATIEEGLQPWFQKATRFHGRLSYHDYEGRSDDMDEQERLVRDLGSNDYMILRNHGLLVCARDIASGFKNMYQMEKSCQAQLAIMQSGGTVIKIPGAVLDHAAQQVVPSSTGSSKRPTGWESLKKMLNRVNPGYDM